MHPRGENLELSYPLGVLGKCCRILDRSCKDVATPKCHAHRSQDDQWCKSYGHELGHAKSEFLKIGTQLLLSQGLKDLSNMVEVLFPTLAED